MKKLFFLFALILSFVTSFAGPVQPAKPCYDDAVIPSYARCFYVTFEVVCCDGIKRSGYLGSNVASGVPSEASLKNSIGMQLHAIPNNVVIKLRTNISTADYRDMFAGQYGKVIVHK